MGISIKTLQSLFIASGTTTEDKSIRVRPSFRGCLLTRNIVRQYEDKIIRQGYTVKFIGWSDSLNGPTINLSIGRNKPNNSYVVTVENTPKGRIVVSHAFVKELLGTEDYYLMYKSRI